MKSSMFNSVAALIGTASAAYAASGTEDGGSLFLSLFLGFGATILVFQLFPGAMLFLSMVRSLFSASKETPAAADKADHAS